MFVCVYVGFGTLIDEGDTEKRGGKTEGERAETESNKEKGHIMYIVA